MKPPNEIEAAEVENPVAGIDQTKGDFQYKVDYAFDAGYQFLGTGQHIVTVDGSFTHEDQSLKAAFNAGASSQVSNSLNQFRMSVSYFYENTYGLTVGWQSTWGSPNPLLFVPAPLTGSRNGKPNSDSFIIEADWIPFGKPDSWASPFANLKIGAQYIAYTRFNGSASNFDGASATSAANSNFGFYGLAVRAGVTY